MITKHDIKNNKYALEAINHIKSFGYKVSLARNYPKYNMELKDRNAYGVFCNSEKNVSVFLNPPDRNMKMGDVIFVLWHEARHVEHAERGMFMDYYVSKDYTSEMSGEALTNWAYRGWEAELECDEYARKKMTDTPYKSFLMDREYPYEKVAAFKMLKWSGLFDGPKCTDPEHANAFINMARKIVKLEREVEIVYFKASETMRKAVDLYSENGKEPDEDLYRFFMDEWERLMDDYEWRQKLKKRLREVFYEAKKKAPRYSKEFRLWQWT